MEAVADTHAEGHTGQMKTSRCRPTALGRQTQPPQAPSAFGERGRMRRRTRFLRKARELAYRDLGGLVFDLHRFGQRNDPLVLAKLATLRQIDTEVRELEAVLNDHRPVTVLHEVGIAACPRCAAIHGSDDRFCPGCGLAFDAKADRPISTAPVNQQRQAAAPAGNSVPVAAPTSAPAPGATPAAPQVPVSSPRPAPAVKPTTTPVAAKPTVPTTLEPTAPTTSGDKGHDRQGEDEPTQILRPPASGR